MYPRKGEQKVGCNMLTLITDGDPNYPFMGYPYINPGNSSSSLHFVSQHGE
jgi:hypothetical protein